MVRIRQILNDTRHRLIYVPLVSIVLALVLSQITLRIDARVDEDQLPRVLQTTVESARTMLSALAGGLISSVTLLLSLMLVAVQLASSQFSPRTIRNWIGDRILQRAIGVVLGTVVYCLGILRETRTLSEGNALTPHLSVIVAVVLGIVSLIAVVRSVDHLTNRLRVGSVASGIMKETVALIESDDRLALVDSPAPIPAVATGGAGLKPSPPDNAVAVTANKSGWIQQIDTKAIMAATPRGSTVYITTAVGAYSFPTAPLAWISPHADHDDVIDSVVAAIALGDSRTMQQDIGFGILQMVDIALRALSPGVNDPNTANDLIVHLGVVLLALWERPIAQEVQESDGRTIVSNELTHSDYLHAAFDPLRLHGASDPQVAATMVRTLATLHSETQRRELPGPTGPIESVVAQIVNEVNRSDVSDYDKQFVQDLAPKEVGAKKGLTQV